MITDKKTQISTDKNQCEIVDLGLCDYLAANRKQSKILDVVKLGIFKNALILVEFFNVYTIGKSGSLDSILVPLDFLRKKGIQIYNVDRGGDITAHNPGQLVVYPIFNLLYLKRDLNWYLRSLEEVVINLLLRYDISSGRKTGLTGVWVGDEKITSIGISVSRWVAHHGLSLNVNNDLSIFDFINPCGQKDCRITSISKLKGRFIDMDTLKDELIEQFERVFGIKVYARAEAAPVA